MAEPRASTGTPEQRYAHACDLIARGREGLIEAHGILKGVLADVTQAPSRGRINQQIWDCERALGHHAGFFSQSGQDRFLDQVVFRGKRDGVFVEVGGYDGAAGSNCLFFELMRGWSGLMVEPSPTFFAGAAAFRRAACVQVAVAGEEGEAEFLDVQEGLSQMSGLTASYDPGLRSRVEADPRHRGQLVRVSTTTLAALFEAHGLAEVDYVSLDVEGAEMAVLSAFPFERYRVAAWTIENNAGGIELPALMQAQGYRRVEALGVDDVYVIGP